MRQNGSFGLTTLRNRHVTVQGSQLCFEFRGKGGKAPLREGQRPSHRRGSSGGARIFLGRSSSSTATSRVRARRSTLPTSTSTCARSAGGAFTAKDFRTWVGTVLAARILAERGEPAPTPGPPGGDACVKPSFDVSAQLGNTPTICRRVLRASRGHRDVCGGTAPSPSPSGPAPPARAPARGALGAVDAWRKGSCLARVAPACRTCDSTSRHGETIRSVTQQQPGWSRGRRTFIGSSPTLRLGRGETVRERVERG